MDMFPQTALFIDMFPQTATTYKMSKSEQIGNLVEPRGMWKILRF